LQAKERVIIPGISPNQSAFIKGRQLVDTVVPVNEIIHLLKKSRREYLIFKVDLKRYTINYVSWDFLDYWWWGFVIDGRFGYGPIFSLIIFWS